MNTDSFGMNETCKEKPFRTIRSGVLHRTQKVDYGLFLLAAIAESERETAVSIGTLARSHRLSFSFLQKVANLLKRAGLIRAVRGKDGGYLLAKNIRTVTLRHIIDALEGPRTRRSGCMEHYRSSSCPRKAFCAVRFGLERINGDIEKKYLSQTLADITKSQSSRS